MLVRPFLWYLIDTVGDGIHIITSVSACWLGLRPWMRVCE